MFKPEVLDYLIDPNQCNNLFEESSSFKSSTRSDFISFLICGLNFKHYALVRKGFHNFSIILVRESGKASNQILILKELMTVIQSTEGEKQKFSVRFIDLVCTLLGDFCSTRKDSKKYVTKEDVYNTIDLNTLFDQIKKLIKTEVEESVKHSDSDNILIGYFSLLEKLLEIDYKIRQKPNSPKILENIFKTCLWNPQKKSGELKCRNISTRRAAYKFIELMIRDNITNYESLIEHGLVPIVQNLTNIGNLTFYSPSTDNKSMHGFLGINNLSNICYMIAMLQQFYMTPAFRYAI